MPVQLRPEVMLIKHSRTKKPVKIMDPDCAICSQPALAQCECEAKGLDIAVRQAEQRMMTSVFSDIRYVNVLEFPSSLPSPFEPPTTSSIALPIDRTLTSSQRLGPRPRPRLHPLLLQHAHDPAQRPTRPNHPPHHRTRSLLLPSTSSPLRDRCCRRRTQTRDR